MPDLSDILDFITRFARAESKLCLDSRMVKPGDVFFAVTGGAHDGRDFIEIALKNGASCVVREGLGDLELPDNQLEVSNLREMLPEISAAYFGNPSRSMTGIAVTGTNGKTTTTHWISYLLSSCGVPCAVLGTIGCYFEGKKIPTVSLTTPDILTLESTLSQLRDEGCEAFAMEASSIGLEQGRMEGLSIKIAAFTNLTRDHLDYHGTMENYAAAKGILFDWPELESAVINLDDEYSQRYIQQIRNRDVTRIIYSRKKKADLYASNLCHTEHGIAFDLHWHDEVKSVQCNFVGNFNVENYLAAVGCALAAGIDFEKVCEASQKLVPPPGRMQIAEVGVNPLVVVDYSHTPDALEKAIETLQEVKTQRKGKLWVLVGAGGDRDPGKRPLMGRVAATADEPIITSDNPRSEDPLKIIEQVASGAEKVTRIPDRAEAIRFAIKNAAPEDVILIAGKGHEDYQEINGIKHHFSDVEEARKNLKNRKENLNE